ncbi:MAG: type II toxin-antitoxin system RelE/ParE family toxin [Desulfuromonadales bacterium]|nr:type II toxin-antitoxin system RelE/ParE family toxin [Desulfuromonadales bacterium]
MSYTILFHPEVAHDVSRLSGTMKDRIKTVLKERLASEPALYGKPLRATLNGYWKLRVGDYRVVFGIQGSEVFVYAICHRREAYEIVHNRLDC